VARGIKKVGQHCASGLTKTHNTKETIINVQKLKPDSSEISKDSAVTNFYDYRLSGFRHLIEFEEIITSSN